MSKENELQARIDKAVEMALAKRTAAVVESAAISDDSKEYRDALSAISKIADPEYRAAAIDGVINTRLRREKSYPDSALGMKLRREALAIN
jgi:hypothetical protein